MDAKKESGADGASDGDDYGDEFDTMVKTTEEAVRKKVEQEKVKESEGGTGGKKSFLQNMVFDAKSLQG